MTLEFTRVNDEVLYATQPVNRIDAADVAALKAMAAGNPRRRIRICSHPSVDDLLHQMLIIHALGNYVPPHRHPGKSESYHMVEGDLDVVLFDAAGGNPERFSLGSPESGKPFLFRLSEPIFHTVIPRSEFVVFHEITNGPFRREDMVLAPWAPDDDAPLAEQEAYMAGLFGMLGG